jgi:hypothetical protein
MIPFQFDNRSEIEKWKILGSDPDKKLYYGNPFLFF